MTMTKRHRLMRTLLACMALVSLTGCQLDGAGSQTESSRSPRNKDFNDRTVGVWITNTDNEAFPTAGELDALFQDFKDVGVNAVYPVVWNKGMPLFQSEVFAKTFRGMPTFGRDALQETIDAAKKHGLKVFAWFEYGLKYPFATGNDGKMVETEFSKAVGAKTNWASVTKEKSKSLPCEYGYCMGFFNPKNQEVKDFIGVWLPFDVI